MKISLNKGNLTISSKDHKMLIGDYIDQKLSDYDIVIGSSIKKIEGYDGIIVDMPGEYEYLGYMIQALPVKDGHEIKLISVDIDGVNLVFLRSDSELPTKKMLDQLGINHILVIKGEMTSSKIHNLVDEFGPQFLMPIASSKDEIEGFSKKLGITIPESQKTLNIDIDDMVEDEEAQILQIVLLSD